MEIFFAVSKNTNYISNFKSMVACKETKHE